jgi:serine/threonine-protein kinase
MPVSGFAFSPALSPQGDRVAFQGPPDSIWLFQLDTKQPTRLTFEAGEHETPVWSPDGDRVAYTSSRRGIARGVFVRAADGTGVEQRLFVADDHIHLSSWSGQYLLFEQADAVTGWDVWSYRFGDAAPRRLVDGVADEQAATLSPDGHFLAYMSNESGQQEVWLEPFPQTKARRQISTGGGARPHWTKDNHLRYMTATGPTSVRIPPTGAAGIPQPVVFPPFANAAPELTATDTSCDFGGEGLVCISRAQTLERFDVMLNWFAKLAR